MNQDQTRALTMLRNVQAYMNEATTRTSLLTSATVSRRRLDEVVANLAAHMAEQEAAAIELRGATVQQHEMRARLLYRHMAPLWRIARSDLDHNLRAPFRMPQRNVSVEKLASVAQRMANAAASHLDDFIAAGLPLDFIARLELATERMLDTMTARAVAGAQRCGTTAAIRSLFAEARKLVDVIDAFVTGAFRDDRAELARWKATRRMHNSTLA